MARPRGRPPLDDNSPSTAINVRVPSTLYDETYKLAQRHRVSVPEMVRRVLRLAVKHEPESPR